MNSVGIDLHKHLISVVVLGEGGQVIKRRKLPCDDPKAISEFFEEIRPFQAVVESPGNHDWLFELLEPLAKRVLLGNTAKMDAIAKSCKKTDVLDAEAWAIFLYHDMVHESYRPTRREQDFRTLVRERVTLKREVAKFKVKIRAVLARHNADRKDLFSQAGGTYLKEVKLPEAERVVVNGMIERMSLSSRQLADLDKKIRRFVKDAPIKEKEDREVLLSIPGVGEITVNVVLAELGDPRRFGSQKKAAAYAGLAPAKRESAGKERDQHITRRGSGLLRWVLMEAAWRLVRQTTYWRGVYEALAKRRQKKRAIVGVGRRLLGVMISLLQSGKRYRHAAA